MLKTFGEFVVCTAVAAGLIGLFGWIMAGAMNYI